MGNSNGEQPEKGEQLNDLFSEGALDFPLSHFFHLFKKMS